MSETHTCNSKCRNPACLIRKERDALQAEISGRVEHAKIAGRRIDELTAELTRLRAWQIEFIMMEEMNKVLQAEVARLREALAKADHALKSCAPSWLPSAIRDLRRETLAELAKLSPVQTESGVKE